MFMSRYKKNNVYRLNPSFTIKQWGLRGSNYIDVFLMYMVLHVNIGWLIMGENNITLACTLALIEVPRNEPIY